MSESFVPKQCLNLHSPYETDVYVTGNLTSGGSFTTTNMNVTGNLTLTGYLTVDNTIVATGNIVCGETLATFGDLEIQGNVIPDTPSGTTYWDGDLRVTGNVSCDNYILSEVLETNSAIIDDMEVQGNATIENLTCNSAINGYTANLTPSTGQLGYIKDASLTAGNLVSGVTTDIANVSIGVGTWLINGQYTVKANGDSIGISNVISILSMGGDTIRSLRYYAGDIWPNSYDESQPALSYVYNSTGDNVVYLQGVSTYVPSGTANLTTVVDNGYTYLRATRIA